MLLLAASLGLTVLAGLSPQPNQSAPVAPGAPPVLWSDPGRVEALDFAAAARGAKIAPRAPFRFAAQPGMGTSAKVEVIDANGQRWRVKSGPEARAESFLTRFVSALGYFAEITWFVESGVIEGAPRGLKPGVIDEQGRFRWVSFELMEAGARFVPEAWTWSTSQFRGRPEFQALKVLIMLVSNWDNKDGTDRWRGSNVGVLESAGVTYHFVNDWGQSLGSWKRAWFRIGTVWDCAAFAAQTGAFVDGAHRGVVRFGYRGQHTSGFADDIRVDDVRWLMQYLGRITDAQIRTGLLVSGASREEQECFVAALRKRIEMLRKIAERS